MGRGRCAVATSPGRKGIIERKQYRVQVDQGGRKRKKETEFW